MAESATVREGRKARRAERAGDAVAVNDLQTAAPFAPHRVVVARVAGDEVFAERLDAHLRVNRLCPFDCFLDRLF